MALAVAWWLPATCCASAGPGFDHTLWDALTERYVHEGAVDYAGLAADRARLDRYVGSLAAADPATFSTDADRLAFWLNAYNACVVRGVLDAGRPRSVKDVPGFFDRIRYRVAGADRTLNEIEHAGRALDDWRMHFGLVCASESCPSLRAEAYQPDWLAPQLAEQARRFLADPQRGLRLEGGTLRVSTLFKWYARDFVSGRLTAERLVTALEPFLDATVVAAVRRRRMRIAFLPYDWSLNAATPKELDRP